MAIRFDHTIVHARNKAESARFLTDVLGLPAPHPAGHFLVVELANGTSLDFIDAGDMEVVPQHYAFRIDEDDFDRIFERIRARGLPHWADPAKKRHREIYHHEGGRGVYFEDPDGHFLEILTRPQASGGAS
jgi:catechol 2,3-dioxygenase-like lactoylglutathione lyase family enzyme